MEIEIHVVAHYKDSHMRMRYGCAKQKDLNVMFKLIEKDLIDFEEKVERNEQD